MLNNKEYIKQYWVEIKAPEYNNMINELATAGENNTYRYNEFPSITVFKRFIKQRIDLIDFKEFEQLTNQVSKIDLDTKAEDMKAVPENKTNPTGGYGDDIYDEFPMTNFRKIEGNGFATSKKKQSTSSIIKNIMKQF